MSKLRRRFVLSAVIFVGVFFLTSCASAPAAPAGADSPAPAATSLPTIEPTREPIAARVNNQTLPLAALDREVNRLLEGMRAMNAAPSDMNAFRAQVLDSMVEQMLIEQAAAIQGIVVTDADIEAELQETIKIAGSRENWEAQLNADRLSEGEYRARLRSSLITIKMRDIVTANICKAVEQVQARHILVGDETTALKLKADLDAGADFAALAAQYSMDATTRQTGGDLGWFARGQLLQSQVEDAAFALPKNAVSAPVKSDLGYHIIQVLDRATDRPVDDETCFRLSEATFERWIQDLASKAQIEKYPNGQA